MHLIIIILQNVIIGSAVGLQCIPRHYGYDSIVCVCNATYCDTTPELPENLLRKGYYAHYMSSRDGERLQFTAKEIGGKNILRPLFKNAKSANFKVLPLKRYQRMKGFGGAMTDSSVFNIGSLTLGAQNQLLSQYFGAEGIGYTVIRIPIAGTDFSTHSYTYDDVAGDTSLSHFNLTEEDLVYKIPYVKKSMAMSPRPIRLLTTSWRAPDWMTHNTSSLKGFMGLQKKYYQVYADYFIKFLHAYRSHGLNFWALTPQNEPCNGRFYTIEIDNMGWSPEAEREWVTNHLGPALYASGYKDLEILMFDDQLPLLPLWFDDMKDPKLRKYVSGFAVHWYWDSFPFSRMSFLDEAHYQFPDKYIFYSEASTVHNALQPAVSLGKWENAENYIEHILQVVNHWATGWLDWNLALDTNGGPNWVPNTVDGSIIVNATSDEFYKQPTFYALAHFSKFVLPGSKRIQMQTDDNKGISSAAFLRDDGNVAIVFLNRLDSEKQCTISLDGHGDIKVSLPAHSMHTILYRHV